MEMDPCSFYFYFYFLKERRAGPWFQFLQILVPEYLERTEQFSLVFFWCAAVDCTFRSFGRSGTKTGADI